MTDDDTERGNDRLSQSLAIKNLLALAILLVAGYAAAFRLIAGCHGSNCNVSTSRFWGSVLLVACLAVTAFAVRHAVRAIRHRR